MPNAEIEQLQLKATAYRQMIDQCVDAINQLTNYTPDGFEFAFFARGVKMFSMPIPPTESEFTLSFFISWRLFYTRQLEDITAQLYVLQIKAAV